MKYIFGALSAIVVVVLLIIGVSCLNVSHGTSSVAVQGIPHTLQVGQRYVGSVKVSGVSKPYEQELHTDNLDVTVVNYWISVTSDYAGPASITIQLFDGSLSKYRAETVWRGTVKPA